MALLYIGGQLLRTIWMRLILPKLLLETNKLLQYAWCLMAVCGVISGLQISLGLPTYYCCLVRVSYCCCVVVVKYGLIIL